MPSIEASQELHMCVKVSCEGKQQKRQIIHKVYMNRLVTILNTSHG